MLKYTFVNLEKVFGKFPKEVVGWALRKAGVQEWLVETVMASYEGADITKIHNNRLHNGLV